MNNQSPTSMRQRPLQFEQRVDDRIATLLARVDRIRLGSTLDRPHAFDREGERHANQVAERDRQQGGK